jgi:hypothetical protein
MTAVLVASTMFLSGALIYASSFLPRSSLSTPLVSAQGRKILGGTLVTFGLAVFAYMILKPN